MPLKFFMIVFAVCVLMTLDIMIWILLKVLSLCATGICSIIQSLVKGI